MNYKTLKEARANGYQDIKAWEYDGEQISLKGHTLVRNPERAKSKYEWKRCGFRLKPNATPIAERFTISYGKGLWYDVYTERQVEPIRKTA